MPLFVKYRCCFYTGISTLTILIALIIFICTSYIEPLANINNSITRSCPVNNCTVNGPIFCGYQNSRICYIVTISYETPADEKYHEFGEENLPYDRKVICEDHVKCSYDKVNTKGSLVIGSESLYSKKGKMMIGFLSFALFACVAILLVLLCFISTCASCVSSDQLIKFKN